MYKQSLFALALCASANITAEIELTTKDFVADKAASMLQTAREGIITAAVVTANAAKKAGSAIQTAVGAEVTELACNVAEKTNTIVEAVKNNAFAQRAMSTIYDVVAYAKENKLQAAGIAAAAVGATVAAKKAYNAIQARWNVWLDTPVWYRDWVKDPYIGFYQPIIQLMTRRTHKRLYGSYFAIKKPAKIVIQF